MAIKHYQLKNTLIKLDYTINNPKKSDKWKIQLTIAINFMSPKDIDEEFVMRLIKQIKSFSNYLFPDVKLGWKYHWRVVIWYLVVFIYYIINPKWGRSYIDSTDSIDSSVFNML